MQSYADAFDRADLAAMLQLFATDAVWDHGPDHIRQGHQGIGDFLASRFRVYAQTSHHIGPPVVRKGTEPATFDTVAYLIATHVLKDGGTYTGYGRYVSTFRDTGNGVLIARHAVVAHVTHGAVPNITQLVRASFPESSFPE